MPKWLTTIFSLLFIALILLTQLDGETIPYGQASVLSVTDGDTITIILNGEEQKVRLLGIDTPELRGSECYAQEAKQALTEKLANQFITLEADPTQADKDRYQRLLRYVYLDELNVNQWLVQEGYAEEYTYNKAYKYQSEFLDAEEQAFNNKKGIWNECYDL